MNTILTVWHDTVRGYVFVKMQDITRWVINIQNKNMNHKE